MVTIDEETTKEESFDLLRQDKQDKFDQMIDLMNENAKNYDTSNFMNHKRKIALPKHLNFKLKLKKKSVCQ